MRKLPARTTTTTGGSHTSPTGVASDTLPTRAESSPVDTSKLALDNGPSQVTIRLGGKISESVYWGSGTWDKIPYSIDAACEVVLPCGNTLAQIESATDQAVTLALQGVQKGLTTILPAHVAEIHRLYASYFK